MLYNAIDVPAACKTQGNSVDFDPATTTQLCMSELSHELLPEGNHEAAQGARFTVDDQRFNNIRQQCWLW